MRLVAVFISVVLLSGCNAPFPQTQQYINDPFTHSDAVIRGDTDKYYLLSLLQFVYDTFPERPSMAREFDYGANDWNIEQMLFYSRDGASFECTDRAVVFGRACVNAGYRARYVPLLDTETGERHRMVEVWLKDEARWCVFDPNSVQFYSINGETAAAISLAEMVRIHAEPMVESSGDEPFINIAIYFTGPRATSVRFWDDNRRYTLFSPTGVLQYVTQDSSLVLTDGWNYLVWPHDVHTDDDELFETR